MRKTLLRNSPSAAILGAAQMCTLSDLNSLEQATSFLTNIQGDLIFEGSYCSYYIDNDTEINVNCGNTVQ